jgi:hypothetical protein
MSDGDLIPSFSEEDDLMVGAVAMTIIGSFETISTNGARS